jgi:hypothetical protein
MLFDLLSLRENSSGHIGEFSTNAAVIGTTSKVKKVIRSNSTSRFPFLEFPFNLFVAAEQKQ